MPTVSAICADVAFAVVVGWAPGYVGSVKGIPGVMVLYSVEDMTRPSMCAATMVGWHQGGVLLQELT